MFSSDYEGLGGTRGTPTQPRRAGNNRCDGRGFATSPPSHGYTWSRWLASESAHRERLSLALSGREPFAATSCSDCVCVGESVRDSVAATLWSSGLSCYDNVDTSAYVAPAPCQGWLSAISNEQRYGSPYGVRDTPVGLPDVFLYPAPSSDSVTGGNG